MITKATELFFQFPSETSKRILHPVEVVETESDVVTARFFEGGLAPDPGQDILMYFEMGREFMQQSARVAAVLETEPACVFAFQTTGEPVSAEGRECYRARTIFLEIAVDFGDEHGCPLQDISATGLAVTAITRHAIGAHVPVRFRHESITASGTVCVQSVRELPSGRFRYGLHSVGRDKADREFRDALNRISLSVQRLQLRRLSGTG
jgi:hypothetical protein